MLQRPQILIAAGAVLAVVLGAVAWFVISPLIFGHHAAAPGAAPVAAQAKKPAPAGSAPAVVLPPDAPAITDGLDPKVVVPFALRLAEVNRLAKRKLVTIAEYHDSDAHERYFTAIVSSCKDLTDTWPLQKGALAEVEARFRLTSEFPKFVFVERDSQGQWGVASCDGST